MSYRGLESELWKVRAELAEAADRLPDALGGPQRLGLQQVGQGEKEGLSFPVLLAEDFLREDLDVYPIPRSWIVDGTGTLRREQTGFDPTVPEDEWIGEVMAEMEALTAAGETAE